LPARDDGDDEIRAGRDTTGRLRDQWFIRSTPPKGMECRVVIIELSGVAERS
jgi:hypothetical protein